MQIIKKLSRDAVSKYSSLPRVTLRWWHAFAPIALMAIGAGTAAAAPAAPSAFNVLVQWTPLLLYGFLFNIIISVLAMAVGTPIGIIAGICLISHNRMLKSVFLALTEFFRNSPWLVLLFFVAFLLPFEMRIGSLRIAFPGWIKVVIGFAFPIAANIAEIVRGAIQSINPGQWEASEALGFSRIQQLGHVILPQCVTRSLPSWMNLYAIVVMSTALASIVGVDEVVSIAGQVQAAEGGRIDLLAPVYGYVMLLFFLYAYPIAIWTKRLETRFGYCQ